MEIRAIESREVNDGDQIAVGADLIFDLPTCTHQITINAYAGLTGDSISLRHGYFGDGVQTDTLTEGVDWTAAVSNAATATSLAAALNALIGVKAWALSNIIYFRASDCSELYELTASDRINMTIPILRAAALSGRECAISYIKIVQREAGPFKIAFEIWEISRIEPTNPQLLEYRKFRRVIDITELEGREYGENLSTPLIYKDRDAVDEPRSYRIHCRIDNLADGTASEFDVKIETLEGAIWQ